MKGELLWLLRNVILSYVRGSYNLVVLTIEPAPYFIKTLLVLWRERSFSEYFNWHKIASFMPYSGIHIEDNIIIYENKVENMTRNLLLK
ncbi:MAG: hypothetical protein ACL7BU_11615 [Candidatus Phlomobacter fragariae]